MNISFFVLLFLLLMVLQTVRKPPASTYVDPFTMEHEERVAYYARKKRRSNIGWCLVLAAAFAFIYFLNR